MTDDVYEIYSLTYAHLNFIATGAFLGADPHDADQMLDFNFFVVRNEHRTLLIDTGFDEYAAKIRNRTIVHSVEESVRALGINPSEVTDVVITHMHYDHTGNNGLFPNARYHLQDAEMNFVTGRCMCHAQARGGFMIEDVVAMVRRLYDGHLCFHDGDEELFPGITLHHMPGHTRGLQAVSVKTKRGTVVLASDAAHFYAHIRQRRVFPFVDSITDVLEGYNKLEKLAPTLDHIVPGHDPLITQLYPAFKPETKGWIHRVDVDQAPFPSA